MKKGNTPDSATSRDFTGPRAQIHSAPIEQSRIPGAVRGEHNQVSASDDASYFPVARRSGNHCLLSLLTEELE